MPVYDLGYRRYEGSRSPRLLRFWPITRTSLRTVFRWPFFAVLAIGLTPLLIHLVRLYAAEVLPGAGRRIANPWGFGDGIFFSMLSYETFWAVLLLTVGGAGQIAEDLRSGAMQIYFAKPITQVDYVAGKLAAVVLIGMMLTFGPGLVLFLGAAAFSPDWSWLANNPFLLLKILAWSLLVSSVLGAAVLALSALGSRGRSVALTFAGIWFFTWILGKALPDILGDRRWTAVHVGQCLEAAGRTFFSAGEVPSAPVGISWIVLGAVVSVSVLVFTRKVDAAEVVR